jgi:hypothetical protein
MGDISAFMKELKQRFSRWFNQHSGRFGTLWAERFSSTLVENSPLALQTVAAYIDLNPVRAGLVSDPKNYIFCGYSKALAGNSTLQSGLTSILHARSWSSAAAQYRLNCGEPGCFVGPGSRWFVGIGGVEAGWSVGWEAC